MIEAGEPLGYSAMIWFIVMLVRAWVPIKEVRDYLDGPARVWGLVLVAAALVVMLDAGGWAEFSADPAGAAKQSLLYAMTAVGIDNVQAALPAAAKELNLNIGDRDR